jgi:hypothetical protein
MTSASLRKVTQPVIRKLFGITFEDEAYERDLRGGDTSNIQIQKTGAEAGSYAESFARF